jgi:hypothetical protein
MIVVEHLTQTIYHSIYDGRWRIGIRRPGFSDIYQENVAKSGRLAHHAFVSDCHLTRQPGGMSLVEKQQFILAGSA